MSGQNLLGGRYELRGVLGYGGMAEVRDGWDTRLCRAVAVKLLHPALNAQSDIRSRFVAEARIAARLTHPNIVAVHDFGEHDGIPFIVMERLSGITLENELQRGPLPEPRVRSILDDLLAALSMAHSAGILHRDIKPSNVLSASESMKVADFGIAKTLGTGLTLTGHLIGTMGYMSPERLAGAAASATDDLYAVGVVGYEAACGRRPFPQDDLAGLARAMMMGSPPPLSAVRPDLDGTLTAAIDRAIAREPGRRFTSAEGMRAALRGNHLALTRGVASGPPPPRVTTRSFTGPVPSAAHYTYHAPPPPRRRRPVTRMKKILIASGALAALGVTAIALATDRTSQQTPTPAVTTTSAIPTTTAPPPPPPTTPSVEPPPKKQGPAGHGPPGHDRGHKKGD